jgi:hypothetical protein
VTFRTVRKRILEGVFRLQRRKEHITFIMVRGYITTMYLLRKINVLIMFITVHRNILLCTVLFTFLRDKHNNHCTYYVYYASKCNLASRHCALLIIFNGRSENDSKDITSHPTKGFRHAPSLSRNRLEKM